MATVSGDGNPGVLGTSSDQVGVNGISNNGPGVRGQSLQGPGVRGDSLSSYGVLGRSRNSSGVAGTANDVFEAGVIGSHTNPEGGGIGVYGVVSKNPTSCCSQGVLGSGFGEFCIGVRGVTDTGFGVHGDSLGTGTALVASSEEGTGLDAFSSTGMAGHFVGPVDVLNGSFTVLNGNKSFKIDHPLDPRNKYLSHNAVESPERKNIYDGVVQLDEEGAAWVDLPKWFEALNGDFRYQLTSVGEAAPNLHVAEEISENRFKIAGGEGGMHVCWQVTGTRQDPWAAANPFEVEQDKPQEDRGRYLQPALYNAPEEQSVMGVRRGEERRRMMRDLKSPQAPELPPEAPELPPGFDFVRQQEQLDELRRQIEELRRGRVEEEIDQLRRQIKKLRRRRKP